MTATCNSKRFSVGTNDDAEDELQQYQLSTTDDEENDETKYPIDKNKPSTSDSEKLRQLYHQLLRKFI